MEYVEIAVGGVYNRNEVRPYPLDIKSFEGKQDCYSTHYVFDEELKKYIGKNKSIKGFDGRHTSKYVPIDIDNEDLSVAYDNLRQLIDRLQTMYELCNADANVFFSGSKGFHVEISATCFGGFELSKNTHQMIKKIALELTSGITIDPAIYNPTRLWRIPNTINSKSNLYKIQLSYSDIFTLTIDEIKQKATTPQELFSDDATFNKMLADLKTKAPEEVVLKKSVRSLISNEKACIYKILESGVPTGERNNALIRLSSYLLRKFPVNTVSAMMKAWNKDNQLNLTESEILTTINSAQSQYDFGCNDELLKKYCDSSCQYLLRKKSKYTVKTIVDLEKEYMEYVNNIDEQKIDLSTWIPEFSGVSRGFTPGEVIVVLAGAGVGKTALLQNILLRKPQPSLFFSYELPEVLTYERFYQIESEIENYAVENSYKQNKQNTFSLHKKLCDSFFIFDPDVSIDEIPTIVQSLEEKKGLKIRIVAIDYLGLVKGGGGSRYERVSYIAEKLKDIAKKTKTVVFCLAQVSRMEGMAAGDKELTISSGKDSGSIENVGDMVMGMYRDKDNDEIVRIIILKNRKGKRNVSIGLKFNKSTLEISSFNTKQVSYGKEADDIVKMFGGSYER